ncbi:MAG: hypothetical protein U0Z26_12380 [Anaerolineales bacterium]
MNSSLTNIELGEYYRIPPATPMTIIGPPACRQGEVWWPVELSNGEQIWARDKFIEPAK